MERNRGGSPLAPTMLLADACAVHMDDAACVIDAQYVVNSHWRPKAELERAVIGTERCSRHRRVAEDKHVEAAFVGATLAAVDQEITMSRTFKP